MISGSIDDILLAYYQWARQNNPADISYPHIESVRRLLGGGIGCEGLSDDEAVWIDKCITNLRLQNPSAYQVMHWIYAEGRSIRNLELHKKRDRKTLARLAAEGREFIRGALFGISECA